MTLTDDRSYERPRVAIGCSFLVALLFSLGLWAGILTGLASIWLTLAG